MIFEKRLPRVHITYDLISDGDTSTEIPFVVGVISNLYGMNESRPLYSDRSFIEINLENFSEVMKNMAPLFKTTLLYLEDVIDITLTFNKITDFEPDQLVGKIEYLKPIINTRSILGDLLLKLDTNRQFLKDLSTQLSSSSTYTDKIREIIEKYRPAGMEAMLYTFLSELPQHVADIDNIQGENKSKIITKKMIKRINEKMSFIIDQLIHHPEFQLLEARWRSLYRLSQLTKYKNVRIKLFNCTMQEIKQEIYVNFDETKIFHEIYETGYGTIGGEPFACIVLDEYFNKTSNDIELLRFVSQICKAAHTPLLAAADANLFGLASFEEIQNPKDISILFSGSDWLQWNKFRQEDSSRYINIVLPRVLVREPYAIGSRSIDLFEYSEKITKTSELCWGSPAYCLAERIVEAFAKYGWAASIRGSEAGGMVESLPSYTFNSVYGEYRSVENYITDRREYELSKLGFIPLCQKRGSSHAIFFSAQSIHQPREDSNNAALSSRVSYVLNASRFAHYIKIIMRDKIGSFQSAEQLQNYLQNWLGNYVLLSDEPGDEEIRARFPLREGRIWVKSMDTPGEYDIKMELRPHFQMEAVKVSLGFVAKFRQK